MALNLPAGGQLVDKAGHWTTAMWAWMRDVTVQAAASASGAITALTGDVTATGPGNVVATIANNAVTFAKMQNINTQRAIGRDTAGSGDPEEVTITQMLDWTP